jgi:hypothetical protein
MEYKPDKLPRLLSTTLLKGEESLTYGRRHVLVAFIKWQNGTDRQIDTPTDQQIKKGLADPPPFGAVWTKKRIGATRCNPVQCDAPSCNPVQPRSPRGRGGCYNIKCVS